MAHVGKKVGLHCVHLLERFGALLGLVGVNLGLAQVGPLPLALCKATPLNAIDHPDPENDEKSVCAVRPPCPPPGWHDGHGEGCLPAPGAVPAGGPYAERVPAGAEVGECGFSLPFDLAPVVVKTIEAHGVAVLARGPEVEGRKGDGDDAVVVAKPELVRH